MQSPQEAEAACWFCTYCQRPHKDQRQAFPSPSASPGKGFANAHGEKILQSKVKKKKSHHKTDTTQKIYWGRRETQKGFSEQGWTIETEAETPGHDSVSFRRDMEHAHLENT